MGTVHRADGTATGSDYAAARGTACGGVCRRFAMRVGEVLAICAHDDHVCRRREIRLHIPQGLAGFWILEPESEYRLFARVEVSGSPVPILYVAEADGVGGSLTLHDPQDGSTEQHPILKGKWQRGYGTILPVQPGTSLYLSVQNGNAGCTRAKIYVRGKPFKTAYSCGDYAIATASGELPE